MGMFDLRVGSRVLIVGGSGGIGSAIARAFLDAGCEVIATGVDDAALASGELAAQGSHPRLVLRTLDVTDNGDVRRIAGTLDRLDVLVNCAGTLSRFKEFEVETFQRVLDVNLTGTFRVSTACRPMLAQSGGCIVNIASMNAFVALPFIPAYCASKGGVVMLTKSLALAWAEEGIRVNALAPGYVETAINAEGRKDRAHYERIASRIAQRRWAQPDDIAGSALFLASPAARYITGTVLAVDGGFLAG